MSMKAKSDKGKDKFSFHNKYDYSETLTAFTKNDKLLESDLGSLICYNEYQLESSLNNFNDSKLNDHLYSVFSTKRQETVAFMHTWVGFFVRQYRTKITAQVQNYLKSKKLNMDEWLTVVKKGYRGDIMMVYILSIMKGKQTCIHLKNRKVWSTLHVTPLHHDELIARCDMHLVYMGFGIFLHLVK